MRRVLLSVVLLGGAAISRGAEQEFTVRGVVARALADGAVTIAHEAVPGYMPAMTMPFVIAPEADTAARRLRPGDRVEFTFRVGATSAAYAFVLLGHDPVAERAAAPVDGSPRRIKEGDTMPAFSLVDQNDRPITREDLRGRHTLLTFVFTRCPVPDFCPRMSAQFQALQRRVESEQATDAGARGLQLLSVTIDPEFDTPAVLRAYGERYGADARVWHFATGSAAEVEQLRKAFALFAERNGASLDHTLVTALIDPALKVTKIWRGNRWKPEEVWQALGR